jgi:hypothetical protein
MRGGDGRLIAKLPGLQRGGSGPMREVVIAAIAGALIGIVVVALLVHFLP